MDRRTPHDASAAHRSSGVTVILLPLLLLMTSAAGVTAKVQPLTVAESAQALRNLPVPNDVNYGYVREQARTLQRAFKRGLLSLVQDALDDPNVRDASAAVVRDAVVARLRDAGLLLEIGSSTSQYGTVGEIGIERPPAHPQFLVARTTISVSCGMDTSLYVFQRSGPGWRLALALEADGDEDNRGTQAFVDYAFSPAGEGEQPFLLAVDTYAWCTSCWHSLRYRVVRPGADPFRPRVLRSGSASTNMCVDPAYVLAVQRDGFALVHEGDAVEKENEGEIVHGIHVIRATVSGDRVKSQPPIDRDSNVFLARWIGLPWEQAKLQVESAAIDDVKRWHMRLREAGLPYLSTYDTLAPAPPETERWGVGWVTRVDQLPPPLPPVLLFRFAVRSTGVRLLGIAAETPAEAPVIPPPSESASPYYFDPEVIASTRVEPVYPERARRNRIEGQVVLDLIIDREGKVANVEIAKSPGAQWGFDVAAIEAVRQWRFHPSVVDGKPGSAPMTVTFDFHLPPPSGPEAE